MTELARMFAALLALAIVAPVVAFLRFIDGVDQLEAGL